MRNRSFLFKSVSWPGIICMLMLPAACKSKTKSYEPTYTRDGSPKKILLFGMPTQAHYEVTDLLVNYLNDHLRGVQVKAVATSNFSTYVEKLRNRDFDMNLANGIQALESPQNGYSILGATVEEESYAGVVLVHKDSSINSFADLKGKTVASPGPPALAGHMLQMVYLSKNGINVNRDVRFSYLESFESVILNIYLGKCAAGFSSTNNWRLFIKKRPEIASKVALKWKTPAVPGVTLLMRNNIEPGIASQLKNIVFAMHLNDRGKKALAKMGYIKIEQADSTTFQPIKDFLKEYDDLVVKYKK